MASTIVYMCRVMVRASDLRLNGLEFDPRLLYYWSVGTGMGDHLWVGIPPHVCSQPPRPTQPLTLCGTGNDYRPKCSDAVRLGIKVGWLVLNGPFNTI